MYDIDCYLIVKQVIVLIFVYLKYCKLYVFVIIKNCTANVKYH